MECLKEYYEPITPITEPDNIETWIKQYQQGNTGVMLKIYNKYEKLLYKLSSKYQFVNSFYTLEDLLQESYFFLERATMNYKLDLENKANFTTYLFKIVNQGLYGIVNGRTSKDQGNKIFTGKCSSLNDVVVGHDDEEELINLIPDDENLEQNYLEIEFINEIHNAIVSSFKVLTLKEINCITSLFGLNSEPINALELADMLGITSKAVSQFKRNAFRKMRWNAELKELYKQL